MPIRITGLNSGLDTEAIISALVSSYDYKTNKYKKAQTKLSWKQDAWKELNTKIYSLYNSVGNLRLSSAYNLKSVTVSDSTKVSVKAASGSVNGTYSVQVTSLAKSGYLTGAQLDKGTLASSTLADLGYTGGEGKLSLTTGGVTTDIKVSETTTMQEIINQLKDAGVNASYDENNRRIYISAKKSGKENDFALAGGDANGNAILSKLGLSVSSDANTAEYAELASYAGRNITDIVNGKKAAQETVDRLTAENSDYEKAINYAKAAKAANDVIANQNGTGNLEMLKGVAKLSDLENQFVATDGKTYKYDADANTYTGSDGNVYKYDDATGSYIAEKELEDGTKETLTLDRDNLAVAESMVKSYDLITETQKDGETVKDTSAWDSFKKTLSVIETVEKDGEMDQNLLAEAKLAVVNGTVEDTFVVNAQAHIDANTATINTNNATLAADSKISADMTAEQIAAFESKATYAKQVVDGTATLVYSSGATRINGSDATIYVNGAEYTGDSNTFSINGMTFTASGVTGSVYDPTESNAVIATVNTDTQGIYDKIKDFLSQYNALINEMTRLYNADSAKGYEPLTDEEKDSLSDSEVEKWEAKIKDSLLRRDDTLSGLISAMTSAMSKGVSVNGETLYLSNFGIKTLGYFNAPKNEGNAYHIDGDADDTNTSGNEDKLMKAIAEDPDKVLDFVKGLASNLYSTVSDKMKATSLSSSYTVYNDKEMASEYSDYTSTIKKWQEKLEQQEDYYYKKFAAMETALSKLNSQTSSLTGMLGM